MKNFELQEHIDEIERCPSFNAYSSMSSLLDKLSIRESVCPPLRVAILRNFTFEPLLAVIKSDIAILGYYPQIYLGNYDELAAEAMNASSNLYKFEPDHIILALWLESMAPTLVNRFLSLSKNEVHAEVKRVLDTVLNMLESIRRHTKAPILINNFPIPDFPAMGIFDLQSENLQINTLRHLNSQLLKAIRSIKDTYLVDYAHIMARIGYQNGYDERYWQIGKAPISRHAIIPFGHEYAAYLRALSGKARKCLVLDCDNTLWGGIVGEDGIEGIRLGPQYPGSCYMAFQREILNLHDRGVILALCSKNNEKDVLEVMNKHPYMILKEEHFAAWMINWDDKATNIQRLAGKINIGTNSMVFVDDNEYEIGMVKAQIPEVAVLKLPDEPSRFRSEICKKGFFDALLFSDEDRRRNKMYREEEQRKQIQAKTTSAEEYLAQLEISVQIGVPDAIFVPRVAQLTQKTNQFNLTTRRYTEDQIKEFINDPAFTVLQMRIRDKISDMGVIGAAIIRYCGQSADLDSFLLSCRALGRGAEDAFLAFIVEWVKSKKIARMHGYYRPTQKNAQVADFYGRHGFSRIKKDQEMAEWELDVNTAAIRTPAWIRIEISQEVL